ncbi:TrkH family potassium uptake protein [Homoserinibacter sp. GY 40078]|uniref:TrkH family potassium uptake protein n=1 Tax=Homoserinibacter sp. GY 40078 TaxID=2603275 RepID=UPI0011C88FA4|nr:potassium transporter TrkG [Homoserinibacter sp. GY 40078]TXK19042.1 TrkH family potassium uptake protein [Homoserinibacter sp. GY 40078]
MARPNATPRRAGLIRTGQELIKRSPARAAAGAFLLAAVVFTGLLSLPIASADGRPTPFHDTFFTAVSAVTVTGLVTVDTGTHWSLFGQIVILAGIQTGGLGIVTLALLLARAVTRQLGVRSKVFAQQSIGTSQLGEVKSLLRTVILTTLTIEGALFVILLPRFLMIEDSVGRAFWHGLFYAVSSFNNAGFVIDDAGLGRYEGDFWILVPIMLGVFIGSFGFPVFLAVISSRGNLRRVGLHAKLTIVTSVTLLIAGTLAWGVFEWANSDTVGSMGIGEKIFHAFFASTMMRSGGFALIPTDDSHPITLLATDALMFVGGGSASTAGGIKVVTLAVLFLAIIAEARGDKHVIVWGRTIPEGTFRLAISVTFLGATLVLVATGLLMLVTEAPLDRILFEVISAFATCGLSVGLSEELVPFGKYVLGFLMLAGRIGPAGLAAALALRQRNLMYSLPEERPIIG